MAIAFIVLSRLIAFLDNRNFWLDEAMLFLSIRQQDWINPSTALAIYEQTAPYGVLLIFKAWIGVVGYNETALRIPGFVAFVCGLILVWKTARVNAGPLGLAFVLMFAGLGFLSLEQTITFKQYMFEFLAAAAIAWSGRRMASADLAAREVVAFAAMSTAALLISNTAPLATGACAVAAIADVYTRGRLSRRAFAIFAVAGLAWLGLAGLWYVSAVRPAVVYQFSKQAYSAGYTPFDFIRLLIEAVRPPLGPPGTVMGGLLVAACAGGVLVGLKARLPGRVYLHSAAAILVLILAILSFARIMPLISARHITFAIPVFALSLGIAGQDVLCAIQSRWGQSRRVTPMIAAFVVLVFGVASIRSAANLEIEEVASALRQRPAECDAVWAYYGAYPSAKIYAERDPTLTLLGQVDERSGRGTDGWFWRLADDFEAYRRNAVTDLRPYQRACVLIAHPNADDEGGLLTALSKDRTCTLSVAAKGARLYICRATTAAQLR